MAERILLYRRFERFWHWSQALLVLTLLATGFEVHGSWQWLGFYKAVRVHTLAAWTLVALWVFAVFWHFTTGEWRQYVPTLERIGAVARYYAFGIFSGAAHPYHKTAAKKHNPLQRMTYLVLLALVSPLIWVSGLLYLLRAFWPGLGLDRWLTLEGVAWVHTAAAFLMLAFVIVHVYLTTTGATVFAHLTSMVTGWEEATDEGAHR